MHYLFMLPFILLASVSLHASPSKTITLAYSDVESFPFQMGNGNDIASPPGLSINILEEVAQILNININYVRLPGKRVLSQIRVNQVDGGFIFSYSKERAMFANYPMHNQRVDRTFRITTLDYSFYKLKGQKIDWDGVTLNPLVRKPTGAHGGFSITNILKEKKIDTLEIESTEKLFEMLTKKRLAVIAIQNNIASSYIDENNSPNFQKLTPPISTKDYYLIFSKEFTKKHPELVQNIWNTIGEVRDEVTTRKIKQYTKKKHQHSF